MRINELTARHWDWVFLEGGVHGPQKRELIAGHRLGVHGRKNEAFGSAVAEMVEAGCIPLAPDAGGQTEIAGISDLIDTTDVEAVDKSDPALRDAERRGSLRAALVWSGEGFSVSAFV